jgi:uncharacterized membrane protein YkoI
MSNATRSQALVTLAFIVASLVAAPAHSDHRRWAQAPETAQDYAPRQLAQQRISIEQAIAIVQRETGGKVLDARAQGQHYRIKVLTRGGEVRVVYVDAATGATR